MAFEFTYRTLMRCLYILRWRHRLAGGLGIVTFIVAVIAFVIIVVSAKITPLTTHQQTVPILPDASIRHRIMQDQRAIARATHTYTLPTFTERFGKKTNN